MGQRNGKHRKTAGPYHQPDSVPREPPSKPSGCDKGATGHMPVPKDCPSYNMSHDEMGTCIIFDMTYPSFISTAPDPSIKEGPDMRDTTDMLKRTFQLLGYSCKVNNRRGKRDVLEILRKAAKDEENIDKAMFVCVFISEKDPTPSKQHLLRTDDDPVSLKDLTEPFNGLNCRTLLGKPKLFFVHTRKMRWPQTKSTSIVLPPSEKYTMPVESDFFICTSGQQTEGKGSSDAFLRHFCNVFDEFAQSDKQEDFRVLLREVNRRLMAAGGNDIRLPSHVSSLTRRLCIRKSSKPQTETSKRCALTSGVEDEVLKRDTKTEKTSSVSYPAVGQQLALAC